MGRTPRGESEFNASGNHGEQRRMDLLTGLAHYKHEHEGAMKETSSAGEWPSPHGAQVDDYSWFIGLPDSTNKRDPLGWWP